MRKLIIAILLSVLFVAPSLAENGTKVNKEGSSLWVCLSFFEYQKVLGAMNSGNADLATTLVIRQDSCMILRAGIEYGIVERKNEWVELVLFIDDGKPHTAYTYPAFVE